MSTEPAHTEPPQPKPSGHASADAFWNAGSPPGPFSELINFTDCDGYLGPVVSKKLAADFAEWQAKADAHPDEVFRRQYAKWRAAFEMAADGGAVDFH